MPWMSCFRRLTVPSTTSPDADGDGNTANGRIISRSQVTSTTSPMNLAGNTPAVIQQRDARSRQREPQASLWTILSRSARTWCRRSAQVVASSRHRSSVAVIDAIRSSSVLVAATVVPDVQLPMIPLSEQEILVLMRSWKIIQNDIVDTGIEMFLRMFEKNKVVKVVFEKFRELEDGLSEPSKSPPPTTVPVVHGYAARQSFGGGGKALLARSTVLRIHGLVVMNAIDEIISSLDETSEVIELILEQGRSHARFGDSLTADVFWAIEEPFIHAVKNTLGDKYNPYLNKLYRKTIHFILTIIVIGFHQVVKKSTGVANDTDISRRRRSRFTNTFASVDDEHQSPTDDVDSLPSNLESHTPMMKSTATAGHSVLWSPDHHIQPTEAEFSSSQWNSCADVTATPTFGATSGAYVSRAVTGQAPFKVTVAMPLPGEATSYFDC